MAGAWTCQQCGRRNGRRVSLCRWCRAVRGAEVERPLLSDLAATLPTDGWRELVDDVCAGTRDAIRRGYQWPEVER